MITSSQMALSYTLGQSSSTNHMGLIRIEMHALNVFLNKNVQNGQRKMASCRIWEALENQKFAVVIL